MVAELRAYQQQIVQQARETNLLIVLPTGLGKTNIAITIIRETLAESDQKILVLAPTRPLVFQHHQVFQEAFPEHRIECLTGLVSPQYRAQIFARARMIIATGASIVRDLQNDRSDLRAIDLIIFDEAHHAHQPTHCYTLIASALRTNTRRHGLTASPGSVRTKIERVRTHLLLDRIIYRDEEDQEVRSYLPPTVYENRVLELPSDIKQISRVLLQLYQIYVQRLEEYTRTRIFGVPDLLRSKQDLMDLYRMEQLSKGSYHQGIRAYSLAMGINFAKNLVETQGIEMFRRHLRKIVLERRPSFLHRPELRPITELLEHTRTDHPKIAAVFELIDQELRRDPEAKIIVFTNYASTARYLYEKLRMISLGEPTLLLGKGQIQTQGQQAALEGFRQTRFNILLCTSVGEEGLDITGANLVVMYEPVVSEIRMIQRRGRTGRMFEGRVVVLIAANTVDAQYQRQATTREQQMKSLLRSSNRRAIRNESDRSDVSIS